jgi:hypothetical protein
MIIYSKTAIFKYDGETSFDLFNSPVNSKDRSDYYKFINNVLYIYGQTKFDNTIPIFFTKVIPSTTQREPDTNSTLSSLDPGQTYYIVLLSEENLPLIIPKNIDSEEFLNTQYCNNNSECSKSVSCYGQPNIIDKSYRDIKLNENYIYDINLQIENILPTETYFYEIKPVYSNWPAKLSSLSGYIQGSNTINQSGFTNGIIKSLFSYYPSGDNYLNSIPYDLNMDLDSNFYYKNIFTILDISFYSQNMDLLFNDKINIKCNECLPNTNRKNPKFNLSTIAGSFDDINEASCSGSMPIYINYSGLDPSKSYTYALFSAGSNWPCRILPRTQTIRPESMYEDSESEMVYGTGVIETSFSMSPVYNPFNSWPNLQYNLEPFYNEKFIDKNIYTVLTLSINEESKNIYRNSIIIKGDIESQNEDCIDSLYVKFDGTDNAYPSGGLTENSRPGSEINLSDTLCCNKDQILMATISGACCGKQYNYRLYNSNSLVSITPLSGTISFGNGVGKIGAVYNLNNRPGTTVRLVISDPTTNTYAVDNIILRCPNKIPTLPT